jgi:HPt (histidine-containing phosphotransfer) domain-containing protein
VIDLERISQLTRILGDEPIEIVRGLMQSMSDSVEQIERDVMADQLAEAAQAAHHCRNDALIVGAKDFLAALEALEQAARAQRLEAAHGALADVHRTWLGTHEELRRVAAGFE